MVQAVVPVEHDDEEQYSDDSKSPEEELSPYYRICGGRLPINLFIISVVSTLLILSCFCIWVASFTVTRQVIEGLSNDLIDVNGEKITSYLNTFMDPLGKLSKSIAYDYNNGIATTTNFRTYLFPKFSEFQTSSCGYFFAGPPSTKYTYSTTGSGNKTYPVYSYQPPGFIGTLRDSINGSGAVTKYNSTIDYTPFYSLDQDYYNSSILLSTQLGIEGVYGNAYKAFMSSMAIYHSAKLYDPVQYKLGRRVVVGVTRVNISLQKIVDFLSKIVLIGKGYCLVSQKNGILVGGSINTLTADGNSNLHILNLTERGAGKLMKQLNEKYGDLNELPKRMVESLDGITYIVSHYTYAIDNLKWNVFFVVYQQEVIASITMTTAISVGVAIAVSIIGIIVSFVIGFIVSKPMKVLERQFELIKVLDLEQVQVGNSVFKEINSIFGNLKTTVHWLKEIKSFIPEHVFEQLINSQPIGVESVEFNEIAKKDTASTFYSKHSLSTGQVQSNIDTESRYDSRKKGVASGLFQMGLSIKPTIVITCQLKGFLSMEAHYVENGFKKIMNNIGPIVKVYKANLQVLPKFTMQLSISSSDDSCGKLIEKGVGLAFKLAKSVNTVGPEFDPRIGVSYSQAQVGNLGTKTSRYFTIVGPCVVDSERLCLLADSFNVNVIIDSTCCSSLKSDIAKKFILKPIDKIKKAYNRSIETIYQVFGEKNTENDEWLYELENSKKNCIFDEYYKAFSVFSEDYWNEISQSKYKKEIEYVLNVLQNYSTGDPFDVTTERLISVLKSCLDISKMEEKSIPVVLSGYYSSFDCSYAGFGCVGEIRALPLDM